MRWLMAALLLSAALAASEARAQWVFDPSVYQRTGRSVGRAQQKARPSATQLRVEADATAGTPRPSMEWDSSGAIGRRDRDAQWRHDEAMTGWQKYLEGLQDGVNAYRPWYPPGPGPLPPAKPRGSK